MQETESSTETNALDNDLNIIRKSLETEKALLNIVDIGDQMIKTLQSFESKDINHTLVTAQALVMRDTAIKALLDIKRNKQ